MNTTEIRRKFELTQTDISVKFNIPLDTVKEWDEKNNMPTYIWEMMNFILNAERMCDIHYVCGYSV